MMNDVEIRLAKLDEANEISRVKQQCWATTYRGIYKDELIDNFDYDKNENTFTSIISGDDSDLYVAIVDEKIVGYMCVGKPRYPYKDYGQELSMLYLLQEYRGQGIGTMMFMLAKDNVKRKGYNEFIVSANKYNEKARKFYLKMGGVEVEVTDDLEDKRNAQVKYLCNVD